MRILALTNLYPNPLQPHRGTFNREQLRALAQRHELRLIAPISWTDEWVTRHAASMPANRTISRDGIQVYHPRYVFPPRIMRGWYGHFFRQSIEPTFSRLINEFEPELIFAAWAYPDGWAAVRLGAASRLPVVLKVHGSDILTLPRIRGRARPTADAVRRADRVIAVSRDLAENVISMGADRDRVSVVYDGIDVKRFHPGRRDEARQRLNISVAAQMLLFVGNLLPVKGVNQLVDACSQLKRRGHPFRCYIVGQGPLRAGLERQILQLGLREHVTLVGPVAHAALGDWYRASDLFVLPSHSEGVPCVMLEAAACQTPYVATRVGGIPEIAHLNVGELVSPGDVAALTEAIARGLATQAPRDSQSAFSRSHAGAAIELEHVFEDVHDRSRKLSRFSLA